MALESVIEMALVREPESQGDVGKRRVAGGEGLAGSIDPQAADMLAEGTPVMLTEAGREMDGVHADREGDLSQGTAFLQTIFGEGPCRHEPGRPAVGSHATPARSACSQHLEQQSFQYAFRFKMWPARLAVDSGQEPRKRP